jgi:hypothetical protein
MPLSRRPLEFHPWTGLAYRATSYDVPVHAAVNRRPGRWNIAGDDSTQYLSLDAEAPWAEKLRYEDLRTEHDAALYRSTIWQLRIDEGAIVDYSDFERAEAAGFPAEALVEDDHERCQAEAKRLRGNGARGLLAPCAALPGATNLTLFGPRVPVRWDSAVTLAITIPVAKITSGSPPDGLTTRVRYYGQPHKGFEEYALVRAKRKKKP